MKRATARTICILPDPGLSGLDGIRRVGVGGNTEMCLILFTPLQVAFNQDEHTPRLQAPNELSDSRRIVCDLKCTPDCIEAMSKIILKKWANDGEDSRQRPLTACGSSRFDHRSAAILGLHRRFQTGNYRVWRTRPSSWEPGLCQ